MAVVGVGIVLAYIGLAVIGFIIAVAVLRWAFGINKIVALLTDISASLKLRKAHGAAVASPVPASGAPAVAPAQFGIFAHQLSVGDWIEDPEGRRLQVVGFKGDDLRVQQEGGEPFRISPPFNYRKA